MTTPVRRKSETVRALHREHLVIQHDHLLFIRDRHLQWMSDTDDPEVRAIHHVLADLLEQAASQYENLLNMLQEQNDT